MKEKFYAFLESKLVALILFATGMVLSAGSTASDRFFIRDLIGAPMPLSEQLKATDIENFRSFIKQKYQVPEVSDLDLSELFNESEIKDYKNHTDRNYLSVDSPGPNCAC